MLLLVQKSSFSSSASAAPLLTRAVSTASMALSFVPSLAPLVRLIASRRSFSASPKRLKNMWLLPRLSSRPAVRVFSSDIRTARSWSANAASCCLRKSWVTPRQLCTFGMSARPPASRAFVKHVTASSYFPLLNASCPSVKWASASPVGDVDEARASSAAARLRSRRARPAASAGWIWDSSPVLRFTHLRFGHVPFAFVTS